MACTQNVFGKIEKEGSIITGTYVEGSKLYPLFVKLKKNKIVIIPFYHSPKSDGGYYNLSLEDEKICQFFSLGHRIFVSDGGIDMLTGLKQQIPYFFFLNCKTSYHFNVNLFSSIHYCESTYKKAVLENFIGHTIKEYNFMSSDFYYDYFICLNSPKTPENEIKKNIIKTVIKKYCHISFLINLFVSIAVINKTEMNYLLYFYIYIRVYLILSGKKTNILELNDMIKDSFLFFEKQDDIILCTIYQYAPRLCLNKSFNDIFNHLSYSKMLVNFDRIHYKHYKASKSIIKI